MSMAKEISGYPNVVILHGIEHGDFYRILRTARKPLPSGKSILSFTDLVHEENPYNGDIEETAMHADYAFVQQELGGSRDVMRLLTSLNKSRIKEVVLFDQGYRRNNLWDNWNAAPVQESTEITAGTEVVG